MLIEFLKEVLEKILKTLDPQHQSKTFSFLSQEICSLIAYIKEDIFKNPKIQVVDKALLEDIDLYTLRLVFSHMLNRFKHMNEEMIRDVYFPLLKEKLKSRSFPEIELFASDSKRHAFPIFIDYLEKYLMKSKITYTGIGHEMLQELFDPPNKDHQKFGS